MKRFFLLRDNQQSGPFDQDELRAMSLRPSDLVWVEKESTKWSLARDHQELKDAVVAPPKPKPVPFAPRGSSTITPITVIPVVREQSTRPSARRQEEAVPALQPMGALKERYANRLDQPTFQPRRTSQENGLWIMGLLFLLFFGAFVVKKMVENSENPSAIKAEPVNLRLESLSTDANADGLTALDYQNALSKEIVNSDTLEHPELETERNNRLKDKVSLTEIRSRAAILQGLDDLQIEVFNGSNRTIDEVNILITFYKSNGETIRSEDHKISALSPMTKKILVIPPAGKNSRVSFKVKSIEMNASRPLAQIHG